LLVEVFFENAAWWFSSLEPYYFRRLHEHWLFVNHENCDTDDEWLSSRNLLYFPALLFQTMAVALQLLPSDATNVMEAIAVTDVVLVSRLFNKYNRLGMYLVNVWGRHNPAVVAVQHDLVRGLWLKNVSRGSEAWYSLGKALR
jgi:hypothetical protein